MRHVSVVLTLTSSGQEGSLSTVGMLASMCGVAEKKADGIGDSDAYRSGRQAREQRSPCGCIIAIHVCSHRLPAEHMPAVRTGSYTTKSTREMAMMTIPQMSHAVVSALALPKTKLEPLAM